MNSSINKFTLISKILSSADKTVGLVNEIKPIYQDLKPLILKGTIFLNKQNKKRDLNPIKPMKTVGNKPSFFI